MGKLDVNVTNLDNTNEDPLVGVFLIVGVYW